MKPISESECIKVCVQKDKVQKSGVMWFVKPPFSCEKEFKQRYPQGAFCPDDKHLMVVINNITKWKLSKKK